MTPRLLLLPLLVLASLGGAPAAIGPIVVGARPPEPGPSRRQLPTAPLLVACPRCGAAVNNPCDRRTLGRHAYHLARVQALVALLPSEAR